MRSLSLLLLFIFLSCSSKSPRPVTMENPDIVTFCVAGDVGNGSSAQREVAEAMEESGCEKLVLLGDLIYPSGIKSAQDTVLFNRFLEPYREFNEIYLVLGNHDYQGNPEAWKDLSNSDPRIIHPERYFRTKLKDVCLFFLDTNFNSSENLYREESDWLKQNISGCNYKVAFTHHPYLSSGHRHGPAKERTKDFFEEFIVGEFQIIFSGHEHYLRDEGAAQGTRQVISGAGGKYDEGESYGYTIFQLNLKEPEKSSWEIIRL